jgi:hypothetical protein
MCFSCVCRTLIMLLIKPGDHVYFQVVCFACAKFPVYKFNTRITILLFKDYFYFVAMAGCASVYVHVCTCVYGWVGAKQNIYNCVYVCVTMRVYECMCTSFVRDMSIVVVYAAMFHRYIKRCHSV